ncbi:alpha/beta fold hydrolase [Neobacillus sp. NRS-1170]|uniref:alpha/beta fold hydrolase n=1 Tax=Neobacillus sp. NRS-1170 TaxID=3233898 RepID=UPI003D2DA65A
MEEQNASKMALPFLRMGNGEPLVLLHGLSECKEGWFKQFEFADQYQLIIPDLRGHGINPTLEGISIENFASDVISLLDLLKIERAHICGFSMGGIVAQEIYRQAPEKCFSLVFACTTPYFFDRLGRIIGKFVKIRSLILSPNQRKNIVFRSSFYSWKKENFDDLDKCLKANVEGVFKSIDAIVEVDNRSLLPEITVPTLVIGAQYDALIPVKIAIFMYKHIQNSDLVILKKAGHIAKIEAAKEFNQCMLHFLSKHPMASES